MEYVAFQKIVICKGQKTVQERIGVCAGWSGEDWGILGAQFGWLVLEQMDDITNDQLKMHIPLITNQLYHLPLWETA